MITHRLLFFLVEGEKVFFPEKNAIISKKIDQIKLIVKIESEFSFTYCVQIKPNLATAPLKGCVSDDLT